MTTLPADEDEFTELVDADFTRVDLVGKGANGVPRFLIAKQDGETAGLMDPGFVRDLIAKAEPEPAPAARDDVTMTGSPGAIAAFIHKASARAGDDVAKAEISSKSKNDLPDNAFAYIEPGGKKDADGKTTPRSLRHFPIHDEAHVRNALSQAPKSEFGDKAMPKIKAAAKRMGIDVAKKESGVADTVTKDMGPDLDEGTDGMDPAVPLAAPDEMGPGDPTDPGSPAWESIDAATAQKWTSIAVRLKNALCVMADREMVEAATADPGDAEAAWDLRDAMCAVDYVIDTLAGFAVGEQAEADLAGEAMDAIGKALAGFDPAPLDRFEGLCAVAKAGRVLSSANEAMIRSATDSLQKVLMSLPAAPVADDPVTKEAAMAADQTPAEAAPEAVEKADGTAPEEVAKEATVTLAGSPPLVIPDAPAEVAKADKEPQVVVYNAKGEVVGIVDPAKIVPVQGAAPAGEAKAADPPADPAPAADLAPAAEPAADAADMTPAPAATAGTPAEGTEDDVAKAAEDSTITITQDALESLITKSVAAALGAQPPAEDVAKQADAVRELGEQVETLKAQVVTLGEQPAMPKVFTNGAVPPAGTLRGQDRTPQGGPVVDVAKAQELKGTLYHGTAQEQNKAFTEMQEMAVAQLAAIQRR